MRGKGTRALGGSLCLLLLAAGCSSGSDDGRPRPQPPTGLLATGGTDRVAIHFDPSPRAITYDLYWDTVSEVTRSTANRIANVPTDYDHLNLISGTTCYYMVVARTSARRSKDSEIVSALPVAPPANVEARAGASHVTVTWDPSAGAYSYNLYWDTSPGVTKGTGTRIQGVISPYTLTGLPSGTECYFVVTGVNTVGGGGESDESDEAAAMTLAIPSNVVAQAGPIKVTVTWDPVIGASSYALYWSTSPGVTKATGTRVEPVFSPYTDLGIPDGTPYHCVVTATNSFGGGTESAESAEAVARTVGPPIGVVAIAGPQENEIRWRTPVPGADGYNIYWSTESFSSGAPGARIAGVTSPYRHAGLSPGTPYHYMVTAENFVGVGVESPSYAEVAATPGDPSGLLGSYGFRQGPVIHHNAAGGDNRDGGHDIIIDASGRIVVAGTSAPDINGNHMVVWRIDRDGTLDTTFGGQGWIVHDVPAGGSWDADVGNAVTIDASGRIVIAGESSGVSSSDMAVWRLLPDGTLDVTFNGQGWLVHHDAAGGDGHDSGSDVTLDASGRILVAGQSAGPGTGTDMTIWRLNPDGTPDVGFGGQGWITHQGIGGNLADGAEAITLDPTGRILAAGHISDDMAVWRLLPDGSLDVTFNGQGWFKHHNAAGGNRTDLGYDIALDASGRILVSGFSFASAPDYDMVVWCLHPDGPLDATFGGRGWITHEHDWGLGMVLDAAGRILVAGGNDRYMTVWRIMATGTLDTTFHGRGWIVDDNPGTPGWWSTAYGISVDPGGDLFVAGYGGTSPTAPDLIVWQITPDGLVVREPLVAEGWVSHHDAAGGQGDDTGRALTLDGSGRILVAGSSEGGLSQDMAVWRLLPDGEMDPTFGGQGWIVHDHAGGEADEARGVIIDPWGRILVTGTSVGPGTAEDMVVWSLWPDGTFDTTFGGQGWFVHHDAAGGGGADRGEAITFDALGRILVAGTSVGPGTAEDMVAWRLWPDGTLDSTHGGLGWIVHDDAAGGGGADFGHAISIDTQGRTLVAGSSDGAGTDRDMVVWRIDPFGTLDPTFGVQGVFFHHDAAGGNLGDEGRSITTDLAGQILVAGTSHNASGNDDMVVWRIDPAGTLDLTFNGQGWIVDDGGGTEDRGHGITTDGSGRILVTGSSQRGGAGDAMIVWRVLESGALDMAFGGQGWLVHQGAAAEAITTDGFGQIIVTGSSLDAGLPPTADMALWRIR